MTTGKLIGQNKRYTIVLRDGDETCWPSLDQGEFEWRLRYAPLATLADERMVTASVLAAYQELIKMPDKERNAVCRALREAK